MPAAWSGSIQELQELSSNNQLIETITTGLKKHYGSPTESEINSWSKSIPNLLNVLSTPDFNNVQVIIELQMPIGAERADIVLLGGLLEDPRAVVIELKQWTNVTLKPQTAEVSIPGYGLSQHPSTQALNYRGKLLLFHSRAVHYKIIAVSFLHNMDSTNIFELTQGSASKLVEQAPIFGREDAYRLSDILRQHLLPCSIGLSEHEEFRDAPYEQTHHLFDVIKQNANDIAQNIVTTLAETGIGLTEEQERLTEEVLDSAKYKREQVFAVKGGPGSGKTLLAVTLLLRALEQGLRCVLAIRNNRLQAILRACFNKAFPGAAGALMYFEVPRTQTGIGDNGFKGQFDLVICDEAQRMRPASISKVLRRAPATVIFLTKLSD